MELVPLRFKRHLAQLLGTLRTWPWYDTARTLRLRFRDDRLGLTASSLTFTTLIALVPLVTVTLALFSAFPMFARFQGALQQYLLQSLVPDTIARPVMSALTQFAGKASRLGTVGLVVLGLTALALVFTIDRTLNGIWRVSKPRPLAQRVMMYWAALTLGPLLLGVSLTLTSYAISAGRGLVNELPGGLTLLFGLIEFTLLAAGMTALFRYVPNTHVHAAHAWAGGLFVAIGFEVAKRVLGWYVAVVPTYSVVYGAFATVPIFLLWIYLGWVIVLLGAVIAAYAPSLAMRVVRLPDRPGERFALALSVLRLLEAARSESQRGLSLDQLAGSLRVDPLQVEPVADTLMAMDWCGRLDEGGAKRLVLLIDPQQVRAEPLVDRLLLTERQNSAAFRQRAGVASMTVAELISGPAPQAVGAAAPEVRTERG
ncbi:YihY family inner membrane protein [Aquabacterium sp.]|uniref:YihY family inner membrane protein n=1 Tax=Aquabacterium sp. TaxID=1872578 RepID=UPI002BF04361|nr:YihY family inner membrane protein [Aquabacterium sp.]HSW03292.1 YihY family inner membrane protein [Aquabacterium sp.]